jgi:hypothetical protein
MAELALREDDAPFSGLGFPYAGIKPAVGALKQIGRCLGGIAREDAVSLWAVALRLRKRMGFADGLCLSLICSLLSLRYAIPRAAGTASLRCSASTL